MELEIKHFQRKPFFVDAVRVTVENILEVAKWCRGEAKKKDDVEAGLPEVYIQVPVKKAAHVRQTQAFPGDWVLKAGRGFKVYTDAAFERDFNEVLHLDPTKQSPQEIWVDPNGELSANDNEPLFNLRSI